MHPGWIIVFFIVATLVALAIGAFRLLRAMRQLMDHADVISSAPIFADTNTLALRVERLGAVQDRVDALRARVDVAKKQLAAAAFDLRMRPGTVALADARDDLRDLIEELR